MSNLQEYLIEKGDVLLNRNAVAPEILQPVTLKALATAEVRSGIRHIRIRDHHIISDSPANFSGYDLGPASPEIFLLTE